MAGKSFFADGLWNFFCDLCGAKRKSSEGVRTWDNFYVCRHHKEERNPQDFLRGVRDDQSVPWARPEPADTFVSLAWERHFAEELSVSDGFFTNFSAVIPGGIFPLPSDPINSHVLNGSVPLTWSGPLSADSVTASEQIFITIGKTVQETLTATDAAASGNTGSVSDAVTASDSLSVAFSPSLVDAAITSDASSQGQIATLADTAPTSDSISEVFSTTLSDSVTPAEAAAQQIFNSTQLNGRVLNGAALNAN